MSGEQILCLSLVAMVVLGAVLISFADAWGKRRKR